MNQHIDEQDRRILNVLQWDASVSMDVLADMVNLSRNACWRRIKQMEQNGTIRAKVTLVDPEVAGLGLMVFALIRTNDHNPEWLNAFEKAVRTLPEIVGAHRMSGELDYVLRVRVADVKGYDRFYQRLISMVPIADISASFVMEDLKDNTALPLI
ncbi:Lrp/AsnC family transcriptional regulator [Thalassococcus sp. S3]|uniref:Lrp/AsnC family transcriptional regulator n=1 Tax=Thalassococcus sp. S3 TaxID=2017482 RepID=UPI001024273B|nr:Lrp/AsnC family transcriptional regulator [Thalassococcus sp. S3]QBF30305.1 transcriptional regulator [Thalassococcus sp. S3]